MKTPDILKYLMWAVTLVLALWFSLGFLIPVLFKYKLADSGQFGDGFGSVNALFSGLGFVALTYTILLQIKTNREQRNQDKFKFLFEFFTEIKKEMDTINASLKNGNVTKAIIDYIGGYENDMKYEDKIMRLYNLITQVHYYYNLLLNYKDDLDRNEFDALQMRVTMFYVNHFNDFVLFKISPSYKDSPADKLVEACKDVSALLDENIHPLR